MKWFFPLMIVFLAWPALAGQVPCGTTIETDSQARELARFAAARPKTLALASRPVRAVNDFLVVPVDEETAPFDDPADLEGMSFLFAPTGDGVFEIRRETLAYDSDTGPLFVSFGRGETTKPLPLSFAFPFGRETFGEVTLSVSRGIHFTDRPALPARNFAAFEMLTASEPLIAPLFDYVGSPAGRPEVFVKQNADEVTITWRPQGSGIADYDVQAVLFRSGNIRFSYRKVRSIGWGGVVLTTGEPTSADTTLLARVDDPGDDVPPLFGESRGMLDLKWVEIARSGGTSMLEVSIGLASPIVRDELNPNANYMLTIGDSINRVDVFVRPDQILYRVPNLGDVIDSAVTIDGATIRFFIDEELLALPSRTTRAWLHTNAIEPADAVEMTLDLGPPPRGAEMDLSVITLEARSAAVETFTVASVNVIGVWNRLQQERGYGNDEIDAVFVYTTFISDLIFKPYGAFALYANPGADGISAHSTKTQPRTPTLVNMNRLGMFGNYDTQVLMHELGHRWLYYFDIMEDGVRRRSLNPLGNHPAAFAHTPAAFNLNTASDSSVMGGATFTELGNGSFRSPAVGSWPVSFAWHELYLMGLARPEEVTPWWYIRDSDPPLALEYYPPADITVNGTRINVGVEQIIEAMGPRDPGFETSQKEFRVLFVVLERAGEPVPASRLEPQYRSRLEEAFHQATGGRGRIRSSLGNAPRRRIVHL